MAGSSISSILSKINAENRGRLGFLEVGLLSLCDFLVDFGSGILKYMSLGFTGFAMLSSDVVDSGFLFPVLFAFVSSIVIYSCSVVLREPWVASSMSLIVFKVSGFASFGRSSVWEDGDEFGFGFIWKIDTFESALIGQWLAVCPS